MKVRLEDDRDERAWVAIFAALIGGERARQWIYKSGYDWVSHDRLLEQVRVRRGAPGEP